MKSHFFIIVSCLLFCSANTALAQDQVSIVSQGGNAIGSGGSMSYSIGQFAFVTATGTTGSLAQGIQDVSVTTALPITLISFGGECHGSSVKLNWETATETNNDFFSVEKSNDTRTWTSIATIKGANTSTIAHTYDYTDAAPSTTASYYRLKQVDINGNSVYSQVVYVLNCGNKTTPAITLYPNPASEGVYLNTAQFAGLTYSLYNISGKLISRATLSGSTTFIVLSNLARAIYIIKVTDGNTDVQTFRIYKN